MSHKLAKVIKYNKLDHQASKSASSINHTRHRKLGDRLLMPSSIANVTTGTFAGLMKLFSQRVLPAPSLPTSLKAPRGPRRSCHPLMYSLLLTALALPVFFSSATYATPYSMTVSIDDNVLDMNVSPSQAGAFSKSSNSTVSVSTTNASGYTLSIASSDRNDGRLIDSSNNDNNTNYLSSITTATTEEQFRALNGTAYNNMWGYLPSRYCTSYTGTNCPTNTDYLPSPTTAGDVLDYTTAANTLLDDTKTKVCEKYQCNEYTLSIGARVDSTQKVGAYSDTYVILATANGIPYTITYKDDTITNFPTDESSTAAEETVQISTNTPTKPGYTFLGWCTVTPTLNTNGTDTCSHSTNGTPEYTPGGTWNIDQTSGDNNLVLYAMWGNNYTIDTLTSNGDTLYMQDFNAMSADKKGKVVASMVEGQAYTVKDTRHATNEAEPEYKIAKLKDGNVWMLDNLRLGSNDEEIVLTPSDTNIGENYTLPVSSTTKGASYTQGRIIATYKNDIATNYGKGSGKVGVYYNHCAATAGFYCYASEANITIARSSFDICPSGWRMPTGGPDGEYKAILSQYGLAQDAVAYERLQNDLSINLSGRFDFGSPFAQQQLNETSNYWTSEYADSTTYAYTLATRPDQSGNAGETGGYRDLGRSIRCLVR